MARNVAQVIGLTVVALTVGGVAAATALFAICLCAGDFNDHGESLHLAFFLCPLFLFWAGVGAVPKPERVRVLRVLLTLSGIYFARVWPYVLHGNPAEVRDAYWYAADVPLGAYMGIALLWTFTNRARFRRTRR